MSDSQAIGKLTTALELPIEICRTFAVGFSADELKLLAAVADRGLETDSIPTLHLKKMLTQGFLILLDRKYYLSRRKDFVVSYILHYRHTIDDEAFDYFAKYFPTELSTHYVKTYEQVRSYLQQTSDIYIRDCVCRLLFRKCSYPLKVCLDTADNSQKEGVVRISVKQALEITEEAERLNLVPSVGEMKAEERFYCFCCGCCCGPLNKFLQSGEGLVHSDFMQFTDEDLCAGCGDCVEACQLSARKLLDDELIVDESLCVGCGVCQDDCSSGAISMIPWNQAG